MNNLNKLIIIFLILCLVFILGIVVAAYEIFPYSTLKFIKNEFEKNLEINSYKTNDVLSLIHVKEISSINETKINLNLFLWNQNHIPDLIVDEFEREISDDRYAELENLDSIDKFTINMEHGINSVAYLFKPINSNGELIIYHQGHKGGFIEGKPTIEYFLEKNYSIIAFSMPLLGMNSQPIFEHPQFGILKIKSHNQLELLENSGSEPIKFFVEPVIKMINYIDSEYNFESIHMIGISGGGWVTTLTAAIDNRINQSFSVAGSYPMFLRNESKNFGDYEQHRLELYEINNYLDLYVMASYGTDRKFVQIFNKYDPCCFNGESFSTYEDEIKKVVNVLGEGDFKIFLDESHSKHIISDYALEIIFNEINN